MMFFHNIHLIWHLWAKEEEEEEANSEKNGADPHYWSDINTLELQKFSLVLNLFSQFYALKRAIWGAFHKGKQTKRECLSSAPLLPLLLEVQPSFWTNSYFGTLHRCKFWDANMLVFRCVYNCTWQDDDRQWQKRLLKQISPPETLLWHNVTLVIRYDTKTKNPMAILGPIL